MDFFATSRLFLVWSLMLITPFLNKMVPFLSKLSEGRVCLQAFPYIMASVHIFRSRSATGWIFPDLILVSIWLGWIWIKFYFVSVVESNLKILMLLNLVHIWLWSNLMLIYHALILDTIKENLCQVFNSFLLAITFATSPFVVEVRNPTILVARHQFSDKWHLTKNLNCWKSFSSHHHRPFVPSSLPKISTNSRLISFCLFIVQF